MMNLNLKTQDEINNEKVKWGKMLPLAMLILVIILLIYAGFIFYTKKINQEISTTKEAYSRKLEDLKSGNAKSVFDFQNRLSESEKIIANNLNPYDSLKEIEKVMIPGVYLSSFQFDAGIRKVILECIASNYNDVSKQIFSFKKSSFFSDVFAGETSISPDEEGKISFKVELKIK